MKKKNNLVFYLVSGALIAAVYTVLTYIAGLIGLSYGQIQFRISEALTVLAAITPAAIPGLTVGCFLGNLGSPFGLVDILCGTLATLLAAVLSWATRNIKWKGMPVLAPLAPVVCNALVVGAEIAYFLPEGFSAMGFLIAALQVGAGEFAVCYGLGLPLLAVLRRTRLADMLALGQHNIENRGDL